MSIQLRIQEMKENLSSRVKRHGREANNSSPSNARLELTGENALAHACAFVTCAEIILPLLYHFKLNVLMVSV